MASKYFSSHETTNFARLSRLVVDVCSDVLRDVLTVNILPHGLTAILQSQRNPLSEKLKPHQLQILYPPGGVFTGTLEDLDLGLLYSLILNLQGINVPPHTKGWGRTPDNTDQSLAANIERLRIQRNEAYGHLPSASLSDTDFRRILGIIRLCISEIEQGSLLTVTMDPDTEKEYIEKLSKLQHDFEAIMEDVRVVDVCSDVLRDVLRVNILPHGLTAILQSQRIPLSKKLKPHQLQILYPPGGVFTGTLEDLDLGLLYSLILNLQGINVPPHTKGWGRTPDNTDQSLAANIERLRIQRNEADGHLPSASLSDTDFRRILGIIRLCISEIEQGSLLTVTMDPDTEKEYIEKLSKLQHDFEAIMEDVRDVCSDVLRDVLRVNILPHGLTAILQSQSFHLSKKLKPHQRQILYPPGGVFTGTLEDLDLGLLYSLIRNLQGINIPPHTKGWGKTPDNTDRSLAANIERLRIQRNEAYGHLPSASLSDTDFHRILGIIRQCISEIEQGSLTGDTYVTAVDNLLTVTMDPDTEKEYIEKLRKQQDNFEAILEEVKEVKANQETMAMGISNVTTRQETIASTLEIIQDKTRQELHPDLQPMIKRTKEKIKREIEQKKGKFLETKAFLDAQNKLQKNRVLVIKGNTGDGKTSTAIRLLHWLVEEQQCRQPLQLHEITKLDLLAPNSKLITFIDDIDVGRNDAEDWNRRITDVETLFHGEQIQANFLLITVRNEIFNTLKKSSIETVFTEDNIIDLSSGEYRIAEEKKALLEMYKPENFSWTEGEIENILSYAPNIGFPQCCQLFCKSDHELQKTRSDFFMEPVKFLKEAFSRLPECSAILFLFLNDGEIKVKDLDPNGDKVNKTLLEEAFDINLVDGEVDRTTMTFKKRVGFVKESFERLLGFLVRKSGDEMYRFDHYSIYFTVALLYGDKTQAGYIQNCPRRFLSYITTSKTSENMVVISSDDYTDMCNRLLQEFRCEVPEVRPFDDSKDLSTWLPNLIRRNLFDKVSISIGSLDVWKNPVFLEGFFELLNEREVNKLEVLNKACYFCAEECALYLLHKGVQPDKDTPLWSLIERGGHGKGDVDVLKKVYSYMNDEVKLDLLNKACDSGSEECALYLLCEGVKLDKDTQWWSLITKGNERFGKGDVDILKKVVKYLNDQIKLYLLNKACRSGSEECALYLLCEGVKPYKNALLCVVEVGSVKLFRELLQHDVSLTVRDNDNNNFLHVACQYNREEMVSMLCEDYPHLVHDTNHAGQTPLNLAAEEGNCSVFKLVERTVLNSLCRVEDEQHKCETEDGREVHRSCACSQYMSQLVDKYGWEMDNCVVRSRCPNGSSYKRAWTILHESCARGSRELFVYLCEKYPALTTAVESYGRTVLHVSCMFGHREMCVYLCESVPQLITKLDYGGRHCLHYIAMYTSDVDLFTECETRVKQYMESLELKYDIRTIRTRKGRSVLDLAKEMTEELTKSIRQGEELSFNNPLYDHLKKVFSS
ncbi:uncharacterized protein LOC117327137 isoform X2 [Pecten maximus]|uniref:uncharacterized protein LOC117327137 isoform X2 n=1 Tax=Pecten maximus TaxID=6579 RepID=UPI001457E7FC|nr:uncharacterized protein LOC117327137 isoform X2 [Pecten maximus]